MTRKSAEAAPSPAPAHARGVPSKSTAPSLPAQLLALQGAAGNRAVNELAQIREQASGVVNVGESLHVHDRSPSHAAMQQERQATAAAGETSEWGAPGSAERLAKIAQAREHANVGNAVLGGFAASGLHEAVSLLAQKGAVWALLRVGVSQAAKAAGPVGAIVGGASVVGPFISKISGVTPVSQHGWFDGEGEELIANRLAVTADHLELLAQGVGTFGATSGALSGLGILIGLVPGFQPIAAATVPLTLKVTAAASVAGLALGLLQAAAMAGANSYRKSHLLHADLRDEEALLRQQRLLSQGMAAFWGAAGGMGAGVVSQGGQATATAVRGQARQKAGGDGAGAAALPGTDASQHIVAVRRRLTDDGRRRVEAVDDVLVGRARPVEPPAGPKKPGVMRWHDMATREYQRAADQWSTTWRQHRAAKARAQELAGRQATSAELRDRAWQHEQHFGRQIEAQLTIRDEARTRQDHADATISALLARLGTELDVDTHAALHLQLAAARSELRASAARVDAASERIAVIRRDWRRSTRGKDLRDTATELDQLPQAEEAAFARMQLARRRKADSTQAVAELTAAIETDLRNRQAFVDRQNDAPAATWLGRSAQVARGVVTAGIRGGRAARNAHEDTIVEDAEHHSAAPPHSSADIARHGITATVAAHVAAETSAGEAQAAGAAAEYHNAGQRLTQARAELGEVRAHTDRLDQQLAQKHSQRSQLEASHDHGTRRLAESAGNFSKVEALVGLVGTLLGYAGKLQHRALPAKVQDIAGRLSHTGSSMATRAAESKASFDDALEAAAPQRGALRQQRAHLDGARDTTPIIREQVERAEQRVAELIDTATTTTGLTTTAQASAAQLGDHAAATAQTADSQQSRAHTSLEDWAESQRDQREQARRNRETELERAGWDVV